MSKESRAAWLHALANTTCVFFFGLSGWLIAYCMPVFARAGTGDAEPYMQRMALVALFGLICGFVSKRDFKATQIFIGWWLPFLALSYVSTTAGYCLGDPDGHRAILPTILQSPRILFTADIVRLFARPGEFIAWQSFYAADVVHFTVAVPLCGILGTLSGVRQRGNPAAIVTWPIFIFLVLTATWCGTYWLSRAFCK